MKNKTLNRTGKIIGAAGFVTLIYNFFQMYNLVAKCPNGRAGCKAYSTWHLLNAVGLTLFVLGIVLLVVSHLSHKEE